MLGEQIKKYRVQRGLTQEALGKRVGVTTQAVSKWERGGVPDPESIPLIADALGVSTDMLFGRKSDQNIVDLIINEIQATDRKEGYKKSFQYCMAALMALTKIRSVKDTGIGPIEKIAKDRDMSYYSRQSMNEGMMDARLNSECRYLFVMPEPEQSLLHYLGNIEEISETFRILSEEGVLKILFYMYSRRNTPVSLSLISEKTRIPDQRVSELMDKMCRINMVKCDEVETENGFIKIYDFFNETVIIPLLLFAKELRDEKVLNWGIWFDRNLPLFNE